MANIAAVEDRRIGAAANMDGFLWGLWTRGTGLNKYAASFRERARSMKTPILRLIGEQDRSEAAQERFQLEARDFGGPFFFAALQGFAHCHFSSAPHLSAAPESLHHIDEHRAATQVLVPILKAFFDAALCGMPWLTRLNVRPSDSFAANPDALLKGVSL